MINIFFSHSSADAQNVDRAQKFFEGGGQIKAWNFRKDSKYLQEIPQNVTAAIQNADYFFILWSNAVAKKKAWVEREFLIADEIEKDLINAGDNDAFIRIVLLDDTPLPMEMRGKRNIRFTQD